MRRPNVICLVIDRLHAGYLGAYGNTWTSTPALDRFAAESFVFDQAIIDSPQLDLIYRSLWLGLHALCPQTCELYRDSLPTIFSNNGWHTALLTDETVVARHPLAAAFSEQVLIQASGQSEQGRTSRQVAAMVDDTDAAMFFTSAKKWLEAAKSPFLLWLHTGTLGRAWDAPLEFRQQFADEDDPAPSNSANIPHRILSKDYDPDELLDASHAYAGQISLVDQMVESLLEIVDGLGHADNTELVIFSPRGISLGEHRWLGIYDEDTYAEVIHVPWMARIPANICASGRSQQLIQPADWYATILDSCGLEYGATTLDQARRPVGKLALTGYGRSFLPLIRGQQSTGFDRACCLGSSGQTFITPAWSLHLASDNSPKPRDISEKPTDNQAPQRIELFVKPDDWFEVNEVSNRCTGTVEKMRGAMVEFMNACQTSEPALLANLPDELIDGSE
jgi:hypothetical protein